MTESDKVKQAQELKSLRENMPAIVEGLAFGAALTRARFLELRKQGFTESEAIFLCKT